MVIAYETDEAEIDRPLTEDELQVMAEAATQEDIERWAQWEQECCLNAAAIKTHIDKLTLRMHQRNKSADELRRRILTAMSLHGWQKVKTPLCTVSVMRRAARLIVNSADQLDSAWVELVRKPMLKDLQEHFKATGEIPDGCDVEEEKTTVAIRW